MIEKLIKYKFKDKTILQQALSHPSSKKNKEYSDNERMEFLGDSILGFLISKKLYERFPKEPEGDLAKRKSAIVCKETLADIARYIELNENIIIGRGEEQSGGRENDANLENALEALIAAIFLDGGIAEAEDFVNRFFTDKILNMNEPPKDPKSQLQEYLQSLGKEVPEYKVKSIEGPSHEPLIEVELKIEDKTVIESSSSKKKAEKKAAKKMLGMLDV